MNLHWDQLSHLNLNLATIDPPTIDPSNFSSSKIEIEITFSKNYFRSELSETNNEPNFRVLKLQKKESTEEDWYMSIESYQYFIILLRVKSLFIDDYVII